MANFSHEIKDHCKIDAERNHLFVKCRCSGRLPRKSLFRVWALDQNRPKPPEIRHRGLVQKGILEVVAHSLSWKHAFMSVLVSKIRSVFLTKSGHDRFEMWAADQKIPKKNALEHLGSDIKREVPVPIFRPGLVNSLSTQFKTRSATPIWPEDPIRKQHNSQSQNDQDLVAYQPKMESFVEDLNKVASSLPL